MPFMIPILYLLGCAGVIRGCTLRYGSCQTMLQNPSHMPMVTVMPHSQNGIPSPCRSRPIRFDVFCDDPPGCGIGLLFWCCQIASGCVTCRRAPLSMPSTTLCSTVSLPAVSHRTYADPYMPWCESCMRQWCYCVFLPIFLVSAWGAYSQFFTPHAPAL